MKRHLHRHRCAICGAAWLCGNPGCDPVLIDTCRSCEEDLANSYWQAREAQADLELDRRERESRRAED